MQILNFRCFTTPAAKTPEIMDQFKGIDSDVTVLSVASDVSLAEIQTKFPKNPQRPSRTEHTRLLLIMVP